MKLNKLLSVGMAAIMLVSSVSVPVFAESKLAAFPGAEGGGMYTLGARASDSIEVYHVTNLNDSGAGSFRDAVSTGNRIIVFDVAGTVMLESELKISKSNLTILGQTAPGEGICIGGESVQFSGANEVVVRYLRFRMGDKSTSEDDALSIRNGKNIIIDHCSVSWSVDECLSMYENMNTTVQNCIISEALCRSVHSKGAHGYGGIWGGINASFHHNLIASNDSRNPRIGTSYTVTNYQGSADTDNLIDIRNNVIYNWGKNSGYGGENGVRVNVVSNYYKPSELTDKKHIHFFDPYSGDNNASTTLHLSDNVMEGNQILTEDNWQGVISDHSNGWTKRVNIGDVAADDLAQKPNDEYLAAYPVTTSDAQTAYNYVLENAGASIYRDGVDTRVVNDVKNGTYPTGSNGSTHLIDSQDDVGGWPALHGLKTADSDNDGMNDEWEKANGLDTKKDDSTVIAPNGYVNIENYANYLAELTYSGYEVDCTGLKAKIDLAKTMDPQAYSEADRVRLSEAIAAAEAVYNLSAPTQVQVDEQYTALSAVLDSLYIDYTDTLNATLEAAKSKDTTNCTNESIAVLNEAIAKAENDLAQKNTAEYEADIAAIEEAMAGLKTGSKKRVRATIAEIRAMDISHLTYSDRKKINARLDEALALCNSTTATNGEISKEYRDLCELVSRGRYKRINEGKIIDLQDFEDGVITSEEYSFVDDNGNITSEIVDGYNDNSSKVLKVTRAVRDGDTIQYIKKGGITLDHFMISADMAAIHWDYATLIRLNNTGWGYYSILSYVPSKYGYSASMTIENRMFLLPDDWTNGAIEVNKPENKVIYYVNNMPVGITEYYGGDIASYGFGLHAKDDGYYDNLKLVDLSEEPVYFVGDCDNNGDVTANDAALCLNRVLADDVLTVLEDILGDDALKYIDMDCSGKLTSNDAAYILAKALKNDYVTSADELNMP